MEVKKNLIAYCGVCSQLNEKPFALEAELANLGPVEGVNFCVPLEKDTMRSCLVHHKKCVPHLQETFKH